MSAPLDEKALDAAHNLIWPATEWNDGEHACRETVRAAIRTYLAASNVNEPPKAEHVCGDALSSVPTDKLEVVRNDPGVAIDSIIDEQARIIREQAERIAELHGRLMVEGEAVTFYRAAAVSNRRRAEVAEADRDRMKEIIGLFDAACVNTTYPEDHVVWQAFAKLRALNGGAEK